MKCEYDGCKRKAKHACTFLYGFVCDDHYSELDMHDWALVDIEKKLDSIDTLSTARLLRTMGVR